MEAAPDIQALSADKSDEWAEENIADIAGECSILNYVDISVLKKAKHTARLPDEEELNSYVFLNEDGSR